MIDYVETAGRFSVLRAIASICYLACDDESAGAGDAAATNTVP
jgi:hypothetical protein